MNDFVYYTPTQVVFGRHSEEKLAELVSAAGAHKVLLHYGSGSVQRTGVLDRARQSLSEAGIAFVELGAYRLYVQVLSLRAPIRLTLLLPWAVALLLILPRLLAMALPMRGTCGTFICVVVSPAPVCPLGWCLR